MVTLISRLPLRRRAFDIFTGGMFFVKPGRGTGQGGCIYFFQPFFAHFLRLCRKKPGYPGFRSAPFPLL
jgi:hypothetical protein